MSKLGKRLIKAAREGRAIARGELDHATYRVYVPADVDVRKIRHGLKLSQAQFANLVRPIGVDDQGLGAKTAATRGRCTSTASGHQKGPGGSVTRARTCVACGRVPQRRTPTSAA